jgi:hypothetical protein
MAQGSHGWYIRVLVGEEDRQRIVGKRRERREKEADPNPPVSPTAPASNLTYRNFWTCPMPGGRIEEMPKKYSDLMQRFRNKEAENRQLLTSIAERDERIETLQHAVSANTPKTSKFREFFASTPVWGAMGVLAGVVLSQLTSHADIQNIGIVFCFFATWGIFCLEFCHIRVFDDGRRRTIANFVFTVATAGATILGWWYLPKPKDEPDRGKSVVAELRKVAPWYFEKPTVQPPTTVAPQVVSSLSNLAITPRACFINRFGLKLWTSARDE